MCHCCTFNPTPWWRVESDQTLLPTHPSPPAPAKDQSAIVIALNVFQIISEYSEDQMMQMPNFTFAAEFQPLFSTLSLWFTVTGYNSRHQTGRFKAGRSQNASLTARGFAIQLIHRRARLVRTCIYASAKLKANAAGQATTGNLFKVK